MKTSLSPEDNLVNRINTLLAREANHSNRVTKERYSVSSSKSREEEKYFDRKDETILERKVRGIDYSSTEQIKTILSPEDKIIKRIDVLLAPEANLSGGRSTTMLTQKHGRLGTLLVPEANPVGGRNTTMLPQKHSRLGTIKEDIGFKIDWKTLNKLWVDPENAIKRKWYNYTFSLEERR